ncbi:MAG: hypothetical protein EOO73_14035 [Myxococcales bacterium]|nr:MAG: hypothetical protein EOO73_14035 [Myxococcales bacterium]
MRRRLTLAALCLLAFALSCAYVRFYLRGGPRIIDATSYFLAARSLAAGSFTFSVPDPSAAFRGRFLLATDDGHALGVIFPPGYPFVLSLAVRLGAPLLLGPALGAALVAATYALARALGQSAKVAMLASALSVCSAALRYHTADTMSHGLSALLATSALAAALRAERRAFAGAAGLCLGLLIATRPVSGAAMGVLVAWVLRRRWQHWPALLLGGLPGVLLLLFQQRALTGEWLGSTQLAYYAVSDAPAGCFRYGFGAGVGCRFEHGDYVARYLPDGFGAYHALRTLLVRLWLFTTDATNLAPLTLLGAYALARHRRSPLAWLGLGIALQALLYVPFYFDGNYPGGGARFLCEVIPFAQILVARAAWDLRLGWLAVPGALLTFALHGHRAHTELARREGGRPMFEPSVVSAAGITRGLLWVDTDHGFNLGHDPRVKTPNQGWLVARRRGDAHDRELYDLFGAPPSYRYVFDASGRNPPALVGYVPPAVPKLEAEAEWPALVDGGSTYPVHVPCASGGRALRLQPGTRLVFPAASPELDRGAVLGWAAKTPAGARLEVRWQSPLSAPLQTTVAGPGCAQVRVPGRPPGARSPLLVELLSGEGAVDFVMPAAAVPPG